jgi:hypothetical protein
MADFVVHEEIVHPHHPPGGWQLLFQRGFLDFHDPAQPPQGGVRFIWRTDAGKLSSRPCRVDSVADMILLLAIALDRGWGNFDGGIHGVPRQPVDVTIDGHSWRLPGDPATNGVASDPTSNFRLRRCVNELIHAAREASTEQWARLQVALGE